MPEMEVVGLKLVTGEEIISKVQNETTDDFDLINPRVLMIGMDGNMRLGPVLFSSDPDKSITLYKSAVICRTDNLREELKSAYLESVSGILIPKKSIIMG